MPPLDECCLIEVNVFRQAGFESSSQELGYNFVDNITKANSSEILRSCWAGFFGNKSKYS